MWYFTIQDASIHDPAAHDSCKNYPKMLKLCRENYVNICPRHRMESDSVCIDWYIYIFNIMNHSPSLSAILHLQAIINHSVQPLLSAGGEEGGGELNLLPNFQIGVAWQEKRGITFFREGCNFYTQKKLKSEIFNHKKVYKQIYFSLS